MNPEAKIKAYLDANKGSLRFATIPQIVEQIKLFVFFGACPIADEEVRKIVGAWAIFNPVWLLPEPLATGAPPAPPPLSPTQDSELIDKIKKAVETVGKGVTLGREGANVNIKVTGLTANLKKGEEQAVSLGVSWGGTLGLEAKSGPFNFSGSLSKDKWELKLSFPDDTPVPNLATLPEVFSKGERAVRNIAAATGRFNNISDAGKVGALIKPDIDAVQSAVEAASGVPKPDKRSGKSFGFSLGSPEPMPGEQGIPRGVQGTVVFTYWF
jgi:hypothetical protein